MNLKIYRLKRTIRWVKNKIERIFIIDLFQFWEKMGFHVTINHFYSPIPDTRLLQESIWTHESDLSGIDINTDAQLIILSTFSEKFKQEYDKIPLNKTNESIHYYYNNNSFESVDGEILYSMIRHFKPSRIIEIGSGNSTLLSLYAIAVNKKKEPGHTCHYTVIDPYPSDIIKKGLLGLSKVELKQVQEIPACKFETLEENDLLFIDSSHILKIGSDVQYEFLEILPRLKKGVFIHFHDIFLPLEYPREWVLHEYRFWNEQYILQAFLSFNNSFEVIWAGSYMHKRYPELLSQAFLSYNKETTWPGSFWMRKVK